MRPAWVAHVRLADAARLDEAIRRNLADLGFWR